jgi:hypothetical protein
MHTQPRRVMGLLDRALIGLVIFIIMVLLGVEAARATEIVPSIGVARANDNGASDAKTFGGLAVRAPLAPFLKTELGVAWRNESYSNGDLTVKMRPFTTSLWLQPAPFFYAGGGVGWYNARYEYRSSLGLANATTTQFGTHLGGGFNMPLAPMMALDVQGRSVFMKEQQTLLPTNKLDPSFWSMTAGLAIKF